MQHANGNDGKTQTKKEHFPIKNIRKYALKVD